MLIVEDGSFGATDLAKKCGCIITGIATTIQAVFEKSLECLASGCRRLHRCGMAPNGSDAVTASISEISNAERLAVELGSGQDAPRPR